NESAANRVTAWSKLSADAATAAPAATRASQQSAPARMRFNTSVMEGPGRFGGGTGAVRRLLSFSGSGSGRAATLLRQLLVVAAFERDPVGDQVLGAFQVGRPRGAGHEPFGLPHHVELAVSPHLADEDRLGDV